MTPPKLLRTVAFSILTFLFAVAMGVSTSFAQVYITPDGDDVAGDGTQGNPYETLVQAIAEAEDGETIFIGGGTYTEAGAQVVDTDNDHTFQTFEYLGTSTATFTNDYTFQGGTEITGNLSDETLEFTGLVTIDDATLNFNGQYLSVEDLTITADGTFNASGSSFSPGGNLDIEGTLALDAGTLLRLTGQTVEGSGDIGEGGEISISSGTVTLAAATTFAGDLLLNASGTLDLATFTLTLMGDFENIQGSTFTGGTGTLAFAGEAAQEFFPRQLLAHDLSVTGAGTELTIRTTLNVDGDVTIGADALVNLGESGDAAVHIRTQGAGTFTNNGGYTTPTDVAGFIIAEAATNITGSGTFGNLDVRSANVTAGSDINFSGTLVVNDAQALVLNANTLTFTDDFVAVSTVNIDGSGDVTGTTEFEVDGDALYDLDIDADVPHTATQEIAVAGVRNLTIDADGNAVTYGGANFEVVGTVTLAAGTTLSPGAVNITLSTDALEHTIGGTIDNGALVVTGAGVEVNGTEDDESDINDLVVDVTGSFNSTDLKAINDVTVDGGTASITMNENAGAANDVTVNDGSLALNMGDDGRSVNSVTLDDGDLSIGSELIVTTTTDQANGDLSLGANDYTSGGVYTRAGTGAITASSGTLVLNANLDNTDASSNDLSVVNLEVDGALTLTTNQDASQDQTLTVTGEFTHTSGALTVTALELVVSGSTYNYVAGSVAGTGSVVLQGLDMIIDEADAANNPQFATLEVDGNLNLVQGGEDQDQPRTVTVTSEFIHTSGQIDFGAGDADADDNNLTVAGAFVRTGGTYVATESGTLTFNGATAFTPGTGFSIPNVEINGGDVTTQAPHTPFTISNSFEFGSAGNLVLDDDDEVIFADGVTITRTGAATISDVPDFGDDINVIYTAAVNADNELPSTVADLEIGAAVTIPGGFGDLTVDGTLTLDGVLTFTDNDDLIITANASIVENVTGSVVTGGDVDLPTVVSSLTLGFDDGLGGPEPETSSEFFDDVEYNNLIITGNIAFTAAVDELAANVTVEGDLALGADIEVDGNLTVDDGTFDMAGFAVELTGGLSLLETYAVNNPAELTFSTGSEVNFTLDDDFTVPAALEITVDKAGGVLTLSGGNLDFANNDLGLDAGIFATSGDAVVILNHTAFTDAGQGFTRGDGVIAGNVRKSIVDADVNGSDDYERVIFPVGSADGYRPLSFNFQEGNNPGTDFDLTVSHVASSPEGTQGLPAGAAVKYPDFHWTVESDLTVPLSTAYEYQVHAEAEGYDIDDLGFTMNDVTLIRRAAGSSATNEWNQTATEYDNELTPADLPIVRGLDVSQLIRTQKRLLTFGIPSTLREENAIAETAINVEQSRVIDISGVFEGSTGSTDYTATSSAAGTVVVDSVSGTNVHLSGVAAGTATVTLTAEDETGDSATSTFDVNVSDMLASSLEDQTVNIDQDYKVSLYDWFTGGSDSLVFSVSNAHDSVSVPSIVGAANDSLEIDLVSIGTDTITVTGIDSAATDTIEVEFALTISGAFAAVSSIDDQTLRAGDSSNQDAGTFTVDSLASFFDGGSAPITYSATSSADDTASVSVSGDTLTVTAGVSSANPGPVTITVTAEDATGSTVDQTFEVTVNPAFGDVLVDGEVTSLDAREILSAAIGEVELTDAQESAADVNEDGNVNAFDASITFRYSLGSVEELPFSSAKVSSANLAYGEANTEEGMVTVPLNIEGSDIVSVDFSGSFNANAATLESLDLSDLPDDWMVVESTTNEGEVKFALAGTTPISEGELALLTFKLKDNNTNVGLSATGFANNSEYSLDELSIDEKPQSFALEQNYPNPFNPTTNVRYQLPANADVTVELFTISGQKVRTLVNTRQNAGVYTLNVDGSRLASGVYIYRIVAKADNQTFTTTKKMTLIK